MKTGTDITFIERLGPQCAIGADDYQWLVLKDVGPEREKAFSWGGREWRAVGFIANSKQALLRCIEGKGLNLSPAGKAALACQDDKLWRWQRAP